MTTRIVTFKRPRLKNPVLVEGLPGIGNVGRISAGYLVEQLGAEKFAELYSSHFLHSVLLHENSVIHLLRNEFYYWKAKEPKQRDLIILIGDTQSLDPEGHYEIAEQVLSFAKRFGVKEIITLGGFSVRSITKPKVVGAVSREELIERYKPYGIEFRAEIGTITGAAGLLLGMAKYYGMEGLCLLGETIGIPPLPDPRSAQAVLSTLCKILNLKLDMSKLERKIAEMERFIERLQKIQQMETLASFFKVKKPEELSYIG